MQIIFVSIQFGFFWIYLCIAKLSIYSKKNSLCPIRWWHKVLATFPLHGLKWIFRMSFVKNLLCECGTQTHRHIRLHESEKALSKWECGRESPTHQHIATNFSRWTLLNGKPNGWICWFVFWSRAVFTMCSLALVTVKAHIMVYLLCAFWQPNTTVYSIYYNNSGETAKHLANVVKL